MSPVRALQGAGASDKAGKVGWRRLPAARLALLTRRPASFAGCVRYNQRNVTPPAAALKCKVHAAHSVAVLGQAGLRSARQGVSEHTLRG